MKTAHLKLLKAHLLKRYATIIEEDLNTDGVYEGVAELLGLKDVSDLTKDLHLAIKATNVEILRWLTRCP